MAGTNIIAVKTKLLDALADVLGIDFDWSYIGKRHGAAREYGYFGDRAGGPVTPAVMAGAARYTRAEDIDFTLALEAFRPGEETTQTAETAVVDLGRQAEEWLAGNWTIGGDIPGLLKVLITSYQLDSGVEDGNAFATLTYSLTASSHVR